MTGVFITGTLGSVRPCSKLDGGVVNLQGAAMTNEAVNYMNQALERAKAGGDAGEVPVGAVLVERASGTVLAADHNQVETLNDPTAHAEMQVIRAGAKSRGDKRLEGCDLYVTLEPCAMCAAAIAHARIGRVIFGAYDPKGGGVEHGARVFEQPTCHHKPEVVGGINEIEAGEILKTFFREKR
ncbi:MAG: nucleoside deaminase [Rhodospirillaceae bacterium]